MIVSHARWAGPVQTKAFRGPERASGRLGHGQPIFQTVMKLTTSKMLIVPSLL